MLNLEKIKDAFKVLKQSPYALPAALLVLGIIILSLFAIPTKNKSMDGESDLAPTEYIEMLENNLEHNIKKLSSVEKCSVMITVDTVEDNEYLENKTVSSSIEKESEEYSRQQEYLVIDDGDDSVVIKSRKMPKISGVLVIYDGASDIKIKKNIIDAVSTVLAIQSNKVFVISNQE